MRDTIGIALCAYNGAHFLQDQIVSIKGQSCQDWQLFIRDDGSSDGSDSILMLYSQLDSRIHVVSNERQRLGAKGNFSFLLEKVFDTRCRYIALSDQDDVWVNSKLTKQLALMKILEEKYPATAILIHSDLEVVDASLTSIAPSLMQCLGVKHEVSSLFQVLLAQNFVTGCTVMANRALLEVALPVPKEALMHDWWLALCAAVFGHIGYIDKPLVKYRQHGSNEVGAKHLGDYLNPFSGKWKKRWLEGRDNLFQSMKQAEVLAERIRQHDPENQYLKLIDAYAELYILPRFQRFQRFRQLGVHAQSNSRQALLLSRLLSTPKSKI